MKLDVNPHLSWSGPGPKSQIEAYALAILVRILGTGLKDRNERTPDIPPTPLTSGMVRGLSIFYGYCLSEIRDNEIKTNENMLTMIKDSASMDLIKWSHEHENLVQRTGIELIDFVQTNSQPGFTVYG